MVPDIFVCGRGGPPPFQLHPGAPRGQRFENTVNTSVFSSSSPQQLPKIMEFTAFFVAVRQKTPQKPMVFDASRLEKRPKKDQQPGKILCTFPAENAGIYTVFCAFPAHNRGAFFFHHAQSLLFKQVGGLSPPPGLRLIPCYLSFTPLLSQVMFRALLISAVFGGPCLHCWLRCR